MLQASQTSVKEKSLNNGTASFPSERLYLINILWNHVCSTSAAHVVVAASTSMSSLSCLHQDLPSARVLKLKLERGDQ